MVMLNKITGYGQIKSAGSVKNRSSTSSVGSFADLLAASSADDTPPVAQMADVGATSAVAGMLALQEITEEEVRRKKLAQHGHNMLESLENLKYRLLEGQLSASDLLAMNNQLLIKRQYVTDPALMDIIDDIELRLAVELAKIETAMRNSEQGEVDF